MQHSLMILLFLQFAVSFAFMLRMISVPFFRWELMKTCNSIIVLSAMFSLPLFSLLAICHCWLIAVSGPVVSIDWLHTLYTVMVVIFLFYFPLIVAYDHLPIPRGSSPCVVTLGCNIGCKMVWVPPGLYGDNQGIDDSELYLDDRLRCLFTISLYVIRAF